MRCRDHIPGHQVVQSECEPSLSAESEVRVEEANLPGSVYKLPVDPANGRFLGIKQRPTAIQSTLVSGAGTALPQIGPTAQSQRCLPP